MIGTLEIIEIVLALLLTLSACGVVLFKQPVHSCLSFLSTLVFLSALYVLLSAEFIAVMQVLIYAGAILVLFIFVTVLFQDAHAQLNLLHPKTSKLQILLSCLLFTFAMFFFEWQIQALASAVNLKEGYGTVQNLGRDLYVDFFFPFEAVALIFLIALVGSIYIAKREDK